MDSTIRSETQSGILPHPVFIKDVSDSNPFLYEGGGRCTPIEARVNTTLRTFKKDNSSVTNLDIFIHQMQSSWLITVISGK